MKRKHSQEPYNIRSGTPTRWAIFTACREKINLTSFYAVDTLFSLWSVVGPSAAPTASNEVAEGSPKKLQKKLILQIDREEYFEKNLRSCRNSKSLRLAVGRQNPSAANHWCVMQSLFGCTHRHSRWTGLQRVFLLDKIYFTKNNKYLQYKSFMIYGSSVRQANLFIFPHSRWLRRVYRWALHSGDRFAVPEHYLTTKQLKHKRNFLASYSKLSTAHEGPTRELAAAARLFQGQQNGGVHETSPGARF